jgi:ADP-heptose:LPS heptosyltransferase
MAELLALYDLADVMVTNDSGPAHYSALTSLDTVVLFGPESPAVFGPVGPRSHVLWAGIPCSPCVNAFNNRLSPCQDNVCMQRLSTDLVFDEVSTVLADRSAARR